MSFTIYNTENKRDLDLINGFVCPKDGSVVVPRDVFYHPAVQVMMMHKQISDTKPEIITNPKRTTGLKRPRLAEVKDDQQDDV